MLIVPAFSMSLARVVPYIKVEYRGEEKDSVSCHSVQTPKRGC
jgi:hypothetical protein